MRTHLPVEEDVSSIQSSAEKETGEGEKRKKRNKPTSPTIEYMIKALASFLQF
jgi:hypothetical protein